MWRKIERAHKTAAGAIRQLGRGLNDYPKVHPTLGPLSPTPEARLTIMVAGLIAVAVGNETAIGHPHASTSVIVSTALFGGPAVFLLAQAWYLQTVARASARVQLAASAALVALGTVALAVPAYVALMTAAASLAAVAMLDARRAPPRPQPGH